MDVYTLKPSSYTRRLDFMNAATEQAAVLLSRKYNRPYTECLDYVKGVIKKGGRLEAVPRKAIVLTRDKNLDRKKTVIGMDTYFETITSREYLVAPSMTVLKNKNQAISIVVKYIEFCVKARKKHKDAMFTYSTLGDKLNESISNRFQNTAKVDANGVSGTQLSKGNAMFSPTIHPILTSICRSASGYANSISERLIYGNRHFWCKQVIYNYIAMAIHATDEAEFEEVIREYGLVYPTVEDVMEMVERCTKRYYLSQEDMASVRDLVSGLTPLDRAIVLYSGDLYSLYSLNKRIVVNMFRELVIHDLDSVSITDNDVSFDVAFEGFTDDLLGLVGLIYQDHLNYDKVKDAFKSRSSIEVVEMLIKASFIMRNTFTKYQKLFKVIFLNDVLPISLATLPDIVRDAVVLSDTDSCVYHVMDWRQIWVDNTPDATLLTQDSISVGHLISFFVNISVAHTMAAMSKNMGVADSELFEYTMKAEFYFPVLALTGRSKHYCALKENKEGRKLRTLEVETKGVGLHANQAPAEIRKHSKELRVNLLTAASKGEKVSLTEILGDIADLEQDLVNRLKSGDFGLFNRVEVKEAESYSQEPSKSRYFHYMLWETVFAPKYGSYEPPPYVGASINLNTDTKRRLTTAIASWEDRALANRMTDFLNTHGKTMLGTIILPKSAMEVHGIPEEIVSIMMFDKFVTAAMSSHYTTLEMLNVVVNGDKSDRTISDIVI